MASDPAVLSALIDKLQAMGTAQAKGPAVVMATGWPKVDETLGGLAQGVVHEWFSPDDSSWLPPVSLMLHLVCQVLASSNTGLAVWIGSRSWPTSATQHVAASRSILLNINDRDERVWATELALRSPSVACAVVDGEGLTMPLSRRLQIAAGSGNALALVVRPARELTQLSAASTRWLVTPAPGPSPRWTLELLRRKGVRPTPIGGHSRWTVESSPCP